MKTDRFTALDGCVHCGFCLPACPTYLVTGDEADSPRGRILLMRALDRGEIPAGDPALLEHLDACLGCRGCEPVCPSGVEYGRGLEAARTLLAEERGLPRKARLVLAVFRRALLWRSLLGGARLLRATGLPRLLAGRSRGRFEMGMLAATGDQAVRRPGGQRPLPTARPRPSGPPIEGSRGSPLGPDRPTALLFRGCVMDTLFSHIHRATRRVLEANGYRVLEAPGQVCCGALHAHAGDRAGAVALARSNLSALAGKADFIVVNSAGCGAHLRDYGHLLAGDAARDLAGRVRDVAELLFDAGPRRGGPLPLRVAYDAPCHLQHAQGVHQQVLTLFDAIPGLELQLLPGYDRCCGSAGIYSLLQPAMSRAVLEDKIRTIARATPRPDLVATGNPGCLMQIGAGLRAADLAIPVVHPVELLDWSYGGSGDGPAVGRPA